MGMEFLPKGYDLEKAIAEAQKRRKGVVAPDGKNVNPFTRLRSDIGAPQKPPPGRLPGTTDH